MEKSKLEKYREERARHLEKIADLQKRVRALDQRIMENESMEIRALMRSENVTLEELTALVRRMQQQHRQHASAAAEVGKAAHAAVSREIGQQHAVRAEGEPGAGARKPRPARPQIVILYAGGHGTRSFRGNRLK